MDVYTTDAALRRELQVEERNGQTGAAAVRHAEPNYFVLGAKSYGRNSGFLMRTGFEQVREVFALIVGKPGLDLYKAR